ncbi:MAG: hypothetical protein R2827_03545 [Bdellovibrionales bacterium]
MDRRKFLVNTAYLATASLMIPWSNEVFAKTRQTNFGSLSIIQGLTSETATQFAIDLPKNALVTVQAVDCDGVVIPAEKHSSEVRYYSEWRVDQVAFVNLKKNHQYQLQVIGLNGDIIDYRVFKTLDMSLPNPKIGIFSCMRDSSGGIDKMWQGLQSNKPDVMMFVGDNVYGDRGGEGPQHLWYCYTRTRQKVPFYHQYELIPVIATWDDHDFGLNNAQGDYLNKENSVKTFKAFYAQDERFVDNAISGPTISCLYSVFGQQLCLFDGRSNRNSDTQVMFGSEQLEWFTEVRGRFDGPVWLTMGSQFFGGYAEQESYEHQAYAEFGTFLEEVARWKDPALFIAGDRHFSEIMDIENSILGYNSVELTSSSMHSMTRPFSGKNPRRRSNHNHKNFMLLEINRDADGLDADLKIVGKKGKIKHRDHVSVKSNC